LTPAKSNGKGLGGPGGYQKIVQAVKRSELIRDGYLVGTQVFAPYRPNMKLTRAERTAGVKPLDTNGDYRSGFSATRMDKPELVGDIISHWKRLGQGRPTIAFGCSVEHSRNICLEFLKAGIPAAHLDADSPEGYRTEVFEKLQDGRMSVLCNYGVAVTGVDLPAVGTIILARPTRSFIVWVQSVGRGVRPYAGPLYAKDRLILLDHAGCWELHGHPDDDIEWELSPDKNVRDKVKDRQEQLPTPVVCPKCKLVFRSAPVCPYCGAVMDKKRKTRAVRENKSGVLVEVPSDTPVPAGADLVAYTQLWNKCLGRAAAYDHTVLQAMTQFTARSGGKYVREIGGLPNVPATDDDVRRKVREVYPRYYGGNRQRKD
jgi:superfamily II DNA or RNA helicase